MASLGNMVGAGRDYLGGAWWIAAFPGLVIVVTTLCISLLGDWLRDRFDPTLRGKSAPVRRFRETRGGLPEGGAAFCSLAAPGRALSREVSNDPIQRMNLRIVNT